MIGGCFIEKAINWGFDIYCRDWPRWGLALKR